MDEIPIKIAVVPKNYVTEILKTDNKRYEPISSLSSIESNNSLKHTSLEFDVSLDA